MDDERRMRPWLWSVAVHTVILVIIIWGTTTRDADARLDIGFYGDASGESVGGMGGRRAAPPKGPSISAKEAAPCVGRYSVEVPERPPVDMLVSHIHDEDNHWSLLVHEGSNAPYKLILAARDSFFHQMIPSRRIVFVRNDSGVVGVEIRSLQQVRRGRKLPPPPFPDSGK